MPDGATAPVLVERSISGKRWRARPADDRLALAISQRYALPEIAGRILAGRGVELEAVGAFLEPKLRDLLPDPSTLKDMDKAVERLAEAVRAGETIGLFGDYDVDGATSTALLGRYLRAVGATTKTYIPDREREGYGPNAAALAGLADAGASLIVTLDCGTTAHEVLGEAAQRCDIIVVDHHIAEPSLPAVLAVVNPCRLDEGGALAHLAAVGVTFVLAVALNRRLRELGHFTGDRREPALMDWLDLVALGTVCDVVPLTGLNRAFVAQGLKVMRQRGNVGLAALADAARLDETPGTYHVGFVLGPRINAGGRVGDAMLGTRLLSTEDPAEAAMIATRLDGLNAERKALEAAIIEIAMAQVEQAGDAAIALAAGEDWHPGVIGIVASRLVERFNRPALVVALAEGLGKGSGRSVAGFKLGDAVVAARQAGILEAGGGHDMAAGFTVRAERLAAFASFVGERLQASGAGDTAPALTLDAALPVPGCSWELVENLQHLAPFGMGNPEPRFCVTDARVVKADIVGGAHIRCVLSSAEGRGRLKAMAFRAADTPLGEALLAAGGRSLHLAGTLRPDTWQGRRDAQLFVQDAAYA